MEQDGGTDSSQQGINTVRGSNEIQNIANGTGGNMTYHEPTEEEMRHSLIAFYIFLFTVIFAQSALVHWRKAHRRSYELVTLIGLWLIPPVISLFGHFWRFLAVSFGL